MNSEKIKTEKEFNINGTTYLFNFETFNTCFSNYILNVKKEKNKKCSYEKGEEKLAEYLGLSPSAIHNWRYHHNGPRSIETIKRISEFFQIDNSNIFLSKKIETVSVQFSDHQIEAVKRIYDAVIDYLFKFKNTDGFSPLLSKSSRSELKSHDGTIFDLADRSLEIVEQIAQKEYFYLHNTEIYYELKDYISDYLYDLCTAKRVFPLRIDTVSKIKMSVPEEYYKAIEKINKITNKYGL